MNASWSSLSENIIHGGCALISDDDCAAAAVQTVGSEWDLD